MKLPFKLPKGVEQTAITVGGNLLATGISSVALIIISRYLGPSAFGEFSVGFALAMIINKVNDLGLNTAIFAHVDYRQPSIKTNPILSSILIIKLWLSVALISVLLLVYFFFGHLLGLESPNIILVAIVFSLFSTYFEHLIALFQSLHLFYKAVVLYVLQSVTKLGIALILLAQIKLSPLIVFGLYSLAPITSLLATFFIWPKASSVHFSFWQPSIAKATLHTAKHTAINSISQSLVDNLSIFFVQAYLSSYETGLLGGVTKIVLLFTLISYFLSQVLYPRVARYTSVKDRSTYLPKAIGISIVILLSSVLILPLASYSIIFSIGGAFLAGLPILQLLLLAAIFQIATVPFAAIFFALKNFWYFTWSGFLQIILLCLGNLLVIPHYGLTGAAYVILATRLVILLLTILVSVYLHFKKRKLEV